MGTNHIRIFLLLAIAALSGQAVKIGISPAKEVRVPGEGNGTIETSTSTAATTTTTTVIASIPSTSPIANATSLPPQNPFMNGTNPLPNQTNAVDPTLAMGFPLPIPMPTTAPILNATLLAQLPEYTIRMLRRKFTPYDYYCPCDLKMNFCDINCCCDVDCSTRDIMQTMKCDDHLWSIHDYVEISSMQPCSVESSLSLFCVVDSHKKRQIFKDRTLSVNEHNLVNIARRKWPNRFDAVIEEIDDSREHYKYGDSILAWNSEAKEMHSMALPRAFGGHRCNMNDPIKHLKNERIKCIQSLEEHNEFIIDLEDALPFTQILTHRRPLNTPAKDIEEFCKTPLHANETANCTKIEIFYCVDTIDAQSCRRNNVTEVDVPDNNCVIDELAFHFHHNFTNILNVTAYFICHESNGDAESVLQIVNVEYFEVNETHSTKNAHQISGNIGYVQHRPILMTKYVQPSGLSPDAVVELTSNNQILAYFESNANCSGNEHFLKMPAIQPNGDCIRSNRTFNTINFDENIRFTCNALLVPETNDSLVGQLPQSNTSDTDSNGNYTNICRAFQSIVFHYLLNDLELKPLNATFYGQLNAFISELGNPKNDSNHWIELKTINAPNIEQIVADKNANGNEFTCRNMVLSIRYGLYFGRIMINDNANQAVIRAAQLEFGPRLDLNFKTDDKMMYRSVPIYIDVMFYDYIKLDSNRAVWTTMSSHLLTMISLAFIARQLVY